MLQLVEPDIYIGATIGTLAVPFVGEVKLPVLLAVGSELFLEILISIVVGILYSYWLSRFSGGISGRDTCLNSTEKGNVRMQPTMTAPSNLKVFVV
ncbi:MULTISPECIES: hypothetical protein [Halorussus]|uniref:hypothetical protein n=1 Tax=Halorussus TaxID=1070314 RepID=UPI00209DBEA5|nr:hypothetical protein [Halorussus vallis]USZ78464.1 hypothetical protein NGM07_24275 [Halorussus vallis]USZ78496.1 hypothetical protein NGM07_23690 [Halorussus vallis]